MSCPGLLMLTLLSLPLAACGMEGRGAPGGLPRSFERLPQDQPRAEEVPPDFEAPLVCNCVPANTDDERLPGETDPDSVGLAPSQSFDDLIEEARDLEEKLAASGSVSF